MPDHVLVIDDIADWRGLLGDCLRELGYEVDAADSIAQATEFLNQKTYTIILLDVALDQQDFSLACQQFCSTLRRRFPGTPVIAISGKSLRNDEVWTLAELGVLDFIPKASLVITDLARKIRAAVDGRGFGIASRFVDGMRGLARVPGVADRPTGTLTFLLTDIENSTPKHAAEPKAMGAAVEEHNRLIRDIVVSHGGLVVKEKGEGDSVFAVLVSTREAVIAACEIQLAIREHSWPTSDPVAVRIGIHAGEAELRHGDYQGMTVIRCARIRGAGHGGQILVSSLITDILGDLPLEEIQLRELGAYELKGLPRPERIFQVYHQNLLESFPELSGARVDR